MQQACKHKKITVENASAANNNITTTTYICDMVFESRTDNNPQIIDYTDVLQFLALVGLPKKE